MEGEDFTRRQGHEVKGERDTVERRARTFEGGLAVEGIRGRGRACSAWMQWSGGRGGHVVEGEEGMRWSVRWHVVEGEGM